MYEKDSCFIPYETLMPIWYHLQICIYFVENDWFVKGIRYVFFIYKHMFMSLEYFLQAKE